MDWIGYLTLFSGCGLATLGAVVWAVRDGAAADADTAAEPTEFDLAMSDWERINYENLH